MAKLPRWLDWLRDQEHVEQVAVLERTPVFAGLPRRLLGRLATKLFEKAYESGDIVFHEGDPGRGLFVVLEGEVEIVRMTPRGERRLASLGPGAAFGELALIDERPRAATARVTAPSRLLILYRTYFETLVEGESAIALAVMRNLLRMLAGYVRSTGVTGVAPLAAPEPAPSVALGAAETLVS